MAATSKALAVGEGIDTSMLSFHGAAGVVKHDEVDAPEKPEYDLSQLKDWCHTPTLKDQFKREGLWKLGEPRAAVFNLSDPEQLDKYNAILAKTLPAGSPGVILASKGDFKFHDGKFFVLLHYQEVLYRVLINK